MATIFRDVKIAAPAAEVWAAIADVGGLDRLVEVFETVELVGDRRTCTIVGGAGQMVEDILSVDHERRRLAYRIAESPLGFTHHSASMEVVEDGDGARLLWNSDLLPAALAEPFGAAIDATAASITRALEQPAA